MGQQQLDKHCSLDKHAERPGFKRAICINRTRIVGDQRRTEHSYAITRLGSDQADA